MWWLWYKWHGGRSLAWEAACLAFSMFWESIGFMLGTLIGCLIVRWLLG